ncbi:hypothetical protein ACWCOW_35325 [Streptomyces sp. NPDC001939]
MDGLAAALEGVVKVANTRVAADGGSDLHREKPEALAPTGTGARA